VVKAHAKARLILTITLIAMVALLFLATVMNKNTAIFYSPHPDDEVLSMGAGIINALNKYDRVIVVLLTKGKDSQARYPINDRLQRDGYQTMDIESFGEARVREFTNSVQTLGVKGENVVIYDLPDGHLKSADVQRIIMEFENMYPNAVHNTMSYRDPHADHAAAGNSLKELKDSNFVKKAIFYVPIQEREQMKPFSSITAIPAKDKEKYQRALHAYKVWDPENGSYSIGIYSVPTYFDIAVQCMESHWHKW
jgi:LmbE family N-acetylglucosaminyl deacetylase